MKFSYLAFVVILILSKKTLAGVPAEAMTFKANLKMVNFNLEQKDKVFRALDLIKKVVASDEFRTRILSHTYNGQKTFVDNAGLSNEEIYHKIIEGSETLYDLKNNAMDVELELYHEATTTIGYTYPKSRRIWMNMKYFNKYTPLKVADNLFHEWVHKLGFDHETVNSARRPYSVPYALGYLMEELAQKYVQ